MFDHSTMKVALVHDYLAEYGGAERVLEALHELFPSAPVYTAFVDSGRMGIQWQRFEHWNIHTTSLSKIPFHKKLFSPLRVLAPRFFSAVDLSNFDLVISSTNAYFAKAVKIGKKTLHLCYCHTPSRSLWGYSTMTDWKKNPLIRIGGELINHYLRVRDVEIARENVTFFIANSLETKARIKKFYRLDSQVIYPPVGQDVKNNEKSVIKREFFLYLNRLSFSKHPELAVQVCTELGLPLKVVGVGKMINHLKEIAGPTIEFCGFVADDQLIKYYQQAKALIYPVEDEDFGIVPVEAMQNGVPVIAHRSGGPLETIQEGLSGIFFDDLSLDGVKQAMIKFQKMKFNHQAIIASVDQFNKDRFQQQIKEIVVSRIN